MLVPYGHAMVIVGIVAANTGNPSDDLVSIANPWNPTAPFQVKFSDLILYFGWLDISKPI